MQIKSAGTTFTTTKGKEAVDFYAQHFGAEVDDYGAGADCWYWTVRFGPGLELSFMAPQGGAPEHDGVGTFYYLELADRAAVDAQRERMAAAGIEVPEAAVGEGGYAFWMADPAGVNLMVHSAP